MAKYIDNHKQINLKLRWIFVFSVLIISILAIFGSFNNSEKVNAAYSASGKWLDDNVIKLDSGTYFKRTSNLTCLFANDGIFLSAGDITSMLIEDPDDKDGLDVAGDGEFIQDATNSSDTSGIYLLRQNECDGDSYDHDAWPRDVTLSQDKYSTSKGELKDANTISLGSLEFQKLQGTDAKYSVSGYNAYLSEADFALSNDGGCPYGSTVRLIDPALKKVGKPDKDGNQKYSTTLFIMGDTTKDNTCEEIAQYSLEITAKKDVVPEAPEKTSKPGDVPESCESKNPLVGLTWLICPILGLIDNSVEAMTGAVDSLLSIDTNVFEQESLEKAWSVFRNFSTFILLAIALFMIISQAISSGPFDAYTVKKVMPRLIAGVILVMLSWFLCTSLIELTNNIAWGIEGMLYAPFGGRDALSVQNILSDFGSALGTSLAIGGIFATVAIVAGGGALLLIVGFAITAVTGLLVALVSLTLRQMVLITLVLVAPIAFVAWILPNTQKFWKLWWDTFGKLLMVYPIIIFVIASGRIFANIVAQTDLANGSNIITFILVCLGLFGPLFLIPTIFKTTSGAFGKIPGMLNNLGKRATGGISDRTKKAGSARSIANLKRAQAGDRFRSDRLNAITRHVGAGPRGWLPTERGRAIRANNAAIGAATAAERTQFKTHAFAPKVMNILAKYSSADHAREEAAAMLRRGTDDAGNPFGDDQYRQMMTDIGTAQTIGFTNSNRQAAFEQLGKTGMFEGSYQQAFRAAHDISNGEARIAQRSLANFEFESGNAGRTDLKLKDNMEEAWNFNSLGTLASKEKDSSFVKMARDIEDRYQRGDVNAAAQMTELRNLQNTDITGDKKAVVDEIIGRTFASEGYSPDAIASVPVEQVVANSLNRRAGRVVVTEEAVRARARGWNPRGHA